MLDENMRTLMRRVNDLEIELNDKTDKLQDLELTHGNTESQLGMIYEQHEKKLQRFQAQY